MRFPLLALAFVLAASSAPARAQTTAGVGPLTLAEALRLAETASPALRAREAQLAAAEGSRREAASLLFNNPELSVERTRRRATAPDGSASEWGLGIAQPIEIGGQQARRREAASASLDALRAEIEDARRQARAKRPCDSTRCSPRSGECSSNNVRSSCSTAPRRPSPSDAARARTPAWMPTSR
jgi:cobalt-zinc-cadmium efflux system outer membrane protein